MTEFATRCVHAGLIPDPSYGSVIPAIHQSSTFVQGAPGQFVAGFDYARSSNPTAYTARRSQLTPPRSSASSHNTRSSEEQ